MCVIVYSVNFVTIRELALTKHTLLQFESRVYFKVILLLFVPLNYLVIAPAALCSFPSVASCASVLM